MSARVREEIDELLTGLPESNLRALLDALRSGQVPLRRWSAAVGAVTNEDADTMIRAMDEGCERIEPESW
ncbi:MAG: hypothetical protein GF320_10100 [Armatimonadia bacterium]|jgi:hypothetical protein|nr:hypothetical protein [Armatimonadia bacterium]